MARDDITVGKIVLAWLRMEMFTASCLYCKCLTMIHILSGFTKILFCKDGKLVHYDIVDSCACCILIRMFSPMLLLSMVILLPNWVWSETSLTFVVVVFTNTMNAILVLSIIVLLNGNCDLLLLNILASNILQIWKNRCGWYWISTNVIISYLLKIFNDAA